MDLQWLVSVYNLLDIEKKKRRIFSLFISFCRQTVIVLEKPVYITIQINPTNIYIYNGQFPYKLRFDSSLTPRLV